MDLKVLGKVLGVGGLFFGLVDCLMENFGICPGVVSLFFMINGVKMGVSFILDQVVWDVDVLFFYLLVNDCIVVIMLVDFEVIFGYYGVEVIWLLDF